MNRRELLCYMTVAGAGLARGLRRSRAAEEDSSPAAASRTYLRSIMPTAERIVQFTDEMTPDESRRRSNGWTYDADLGWVHCSAIHSNGVDRSKTFYHYEEDGARKLGQFADRSCRVHAYGNSFTHCDQVSDGETWAEYLAAHLQEPIRNYGVGGYSVYQAYRRMLKVEEQRGAEYIILNIYDDDHFRNLDAWRSIRVGSGSQCGFTLPHVRVNLREDRCDQVENLLRTRNEVRRLRDEEFIWQTFQEDPILQLSMALRAEDPGTHEVRSIADRFGVSEERFGAGTPAEQIRRIHVEAALYATRKIIGWTEDFVNNTGKKLLLVLSFGRTNIANELAGRSRFDQSLVDWLRGKSYPVIDMRDAFKEEYSQSKSEIGSFLSRYYNGHHTPPGNYFTAWTLKDHVTKWLDPAPLPYR